MTGEKMPTGTMTSGSKDTVYSKKQLFKRYTVKLMSLILSDGRSYAGFVHNVSEEGVAFETYAFATKLKELSSKKIINLIIKMPSGEILNLSCEIIWSSRHSPLRLLQNYTTHIIGMSIIDPPLHFREYVKTLQ
jgi:hypothetical protein